MYTQTDIDGIQNAIGWGDVIEGNLNNSLVIINDLVLSKTIFKKVNKTLDDGTKKEVVQVDYSELTLVSEIERVVVEFDKSHPCFRLHLKSGADTFFKVAESASVNVIISIIMTHLDNNKNNNNK